MQYYILELNKILHW